MDEESFREAADHMVARAIEEEIKAARETSPNRKQVMLARAASFRALEEQLVPPRTELLLTVRLR